MQPAFFISNNRILPVVGLGAWLMASGMGMMKLMKYSQTPADKLEPPHRWPDDCAIAPKAGLPVLLMFVHPHCPCSRASMAELAILMRHCQDLVSTHVLFVRAPGLGDAWEKTNLWDSAEDIPQVQVQCDVDGNEARRFGATTSGSVLLYDKNRRLAFAGGITSGRGHSGDNAGRTAITSMLKEKGSGILGTAVFGCELFSASEMEAPCCRHK